MSYIEGLWRREPARVSAAVAAVVVFVCAKTGIVVSEQDTLVAVAIVLPLVLGGEATRKEVIPLHSLAVPPENVPGDHVSRP